MSNRYYIFLIAIFYSITSAFTASEPKGYVIAGTKIIMYRVTCDNGDWVDFDTFASAKSGGASSCKGMGSSLADIKARKGTVSSSPVGKDIPNSNIGPRHPAAQLGKPIKVQMKNE